MKGPSGLAFDQENNLHVVDRDNHRVQVFTKDGKFLRSLGSFGSGDGEFNMPWGVTIDSRGDVYVADWGNDRVQKFAADGRFLASFGTSGADIGQFNRPSDVAVDRDGDIYVTDWGNHRVQVFTPDWSYICVLAGDATVSKSGSQQLASNPDLIRQMQLASTRDLGPWRRFWYPVAVEVDEAGNIIVADSCWHRLQVYTKKMVSAGAYT